MPRKGYSSSTLDNELLSVIDKLCKKHGCRTRPELIRRLIQIEAEHETMKLSILGGISGGHPSKGYAVADARSKFLIRTQKKAIRDTNVLRRMSTCPLHNIMPLQAVYEAYSESYDRSVFV